MEQTTLCSTKIVRRLSLGQPATYQIKVQGWLGSDWADWFDGLTISAEQIQEGISVTTLTGKAVDGQQGQPQAVQFVQ